MGASWPCGTEWADRVSPGHREEAWWGGAQTRVWAGSPRPPRSTCVTLGKSPSFSELPAPSSVKGGWVVTIPDFPGTWRSVNSHP